MRLKDFILPLSLMVMAMPAGATVPSCAVTVVRDYPHDATAFTEGLLIADGLLYESTGQFGQSRIIARRLDKTTPLKSVANDSHEFGEGIADWRGELLSLTWRNGIGHRYDRRTLQRTASFRVATEGWGMTRNGNRIYMSDGTSTLQIRDAATMRPVGQLTVSAEGKPVPYLNELEWIDGEIWANVWLSDTIVRIDPHSGAVKSRLDLAMLRPPLADRDAVLNGIAYDAATRRIFVTGKYWPKLYEISVGSCH